MKFRCVTRVLLAVFCLQIAAYAGAVEDPAAPATVVRNLPEMIVDDGQLLTHRFHVFVTEEQITDAMHPVLTLDGLHTSGKESPKFIPKRVLSNQIHRDNVDGQELSFTGTHLVFDISELQPRGWRGWDLLKNQLKAANRFRPLITWTPLPAADGTVSKERQVSTTQEIFLGNLAGGVFWTSAGIVGLLLLLYRWSVVKAKGIQAFKVRPALLLATGPDGYLSLWRTQLILWTVAVGSMVLLFGLLRLGVPEIPPTLVLLMGMAMLTGTVSAKKAAGDSSPDTPPPPAPAPALVNTSPINPGKPLFSDLVSVINKRTGEPELSIPKAQMFFWTMVILGMFVVKSFLLGDLWPVPIEMVALTGVSQLGYVGDKFIQSGN